MFNHRENALKAHQHISYCSIRREHFKKKIIQNLIKIFTKTHQIAHFFKNFSQGTYSMSPNMCAADIIISI